MGLRFRMAEIEHDRRGDREAALEHLRLVLDGDPDHPGAITMLEGMLSDIAVQGAAAELLEPVYAARADWPALIKIGEIRLLQTEEPAQRLAWTKRIARLYEEQLEDYDSALRWYGRVFQEAPTERLSLEQLVRLADKLNRWQDLAVLLSGYLEGELGEEPVVLDIVRRTAEIFDARLGQRAEAEKLYRRLFDARPDDRDVAQLFESALERWGAWQELRELIDEEAGRAVDPVAKLGVPAPQRQAGRGAPGRARARDQHAARGDGRRSDRPRHRGGAGTPAGSGRAVARPRRPPVVQPRSRQRPARGRRRSACGWRSSCATASATPRPPSTVSRRCCSRRRASVTRSPALEALARQGTERYRVAVILEPVYRASGDLTKLVGALDAELESVDDRSERVRILREMAEIHQRLGRPEAAFDCRSRAWLTDVDSAETLSEMEALGTAGGMHGELVVALEKGAVEAGDPHLQAQLWAMAARLLEDPLGRAADAVEAWRSALAARPDEPEIFLALERLLSGAARSSELVEVLEKHLEIANDVIERKSIAKRIAVLYEDALKQRESAVRAWETVLDIDPSDGDALDSLAQLHLAAGSYRDLADVFTRKIELSTRPEERRMLLAQSAHIYEQQLSEPEQAIDQLRRLLEETPGDAEALSDLDRIFSSEGRHSDLIEVLDARAARETRPAARDELAFRAARLMETELSDVEGAIGRYHQILAASPDHAGRA